MTKEEFSEQMKQICVNEDFDNEYSHSKADSLMYKALKELGYDLTEYDKVSDGFWYA